MSSPQMNSALAGTSTTARLNQELRALCGTPNFIAAVLTDSDGLPIVTASNGPEPLGEMLAAIASLVERMVQRANQRVGLPIASEVIVNNVNRSRLVCRFFDTRQQPAILACLVSDQGTYRRAMNTAIRRIEAAWDR